MKDTPLVFTDCRTPAASFNMMARHPEFTIHNHQTIMKNPHLTSLLFHVRAALLAAVFLPAALFAQAFPTWQGTGTNWSTPANWNVALAYGQLQWTGGGNATSWNDNPAGADMWRFYFEGGQSYTLGGNAVRLFDFGGTNGGILSGSSVLQTINMNLSFRDSGARPMAILTTNSGGLTFNGQIEMTNNMTFLGIMGTNTASDITFNGSIVGNKGVVIGTNTFLSNGTFGTATRVYFNASNSYSGTTEIRRGTLFITNGNALSTNNVVMALANNSNNIQAILQVNGTTTASNTFAFGDGSSNATINVTNSSQFTITGNLINESGANTGTKFAKSGAGTLILAGTASTYAGQMQIGQGTVIIGNSSALSTNITTANRGIDLGLNVRDFNQANPVTLLLSNGVTLSQSIYVAANTVSLVDYARTIGIAGSGSATVNNQIYLDGNLTANAGSGNTLTFSGNLTNTGGLIKIGTGTLILSASNAYTGLLDISNGAVLASVSRSVSQGGSTTVRSGAALELTNSTFQVATNITINGSGIGGTGAIRSIGGSNEIRRNISLGSDSVIGADVGAYLVISNFATNGAATINGTGLNLTVGGDGDTRLTANATLTTIGPGAGGSLTKTGNGTLTLVGTNNYTGNTTVSGGRLTIFNGASNAILSSNIIINGGDLFHVNGGGNASHLITNTANMQISSGSYNLQFLSQNLAQLDMSGGSMNITDFATVNFNGASSATGGAINLAGGQSRANFNNGVALGGATFTYNSTTNSLNFATRLSNSVTYASTNTAATWFTNAGAGIGIMELGGTGASTTNTFDIADAGSVASEVNIDWIVANGFGTSLVKTGNGVLTFGGSAANTYSGSTVISNGTLALNKTASTTAVAGNVEVGAGATLLISASEQVADTSAVTLSGGTIERGSGVSETFGDLTLTTASTLDYVGGTAGTLEFGTYAPGSLVLTLNNFGAYNTLKFSSDLRSFISTTTGSSFSNANFSLNGMTAGGFTAGWDGSTFTITSIPEPTTYAAAAGLLGLMLYSPLRRRLRKKRS